MCEGAARIHMQKHGTKSYDHQKTHRLRHRSSELFLFQDQETMTAC